MIVCNLERKVVGQERRELEGEDEDLQSRCPASTAVWSNGVGADENAGEAIRFV